MVTLPTMSIITPSLNQGNFIEETINSVLDQNYPNLEFIVIDGGSTDATLEILKKYERHLFWISEADHGQAEAINKGMKRANSEIVAFLNSDDLYLPGALHLIGRYFSEHPEAAWLTGYCRNINAKGMEIRRLIRLYKNFWLSVGNYRTTLILNFISQPATFWRREVLEKVGILDESLHYSMDYEYWLRIGQRYRLHVMKHDLAAFRIHPKSKSGSTTFKQFDEELMVASNYAGTAVKLFHKFHRDLTVAIYQRIMKMES